MINNRKSEELCVTKNSKRKKRLIYIIAILTIFLLFHAVRLIAYQYGYLKGYHDTWEQLTSNDSTE
ncbi:MAG: hypothetical protein K0R15_1615 [Clostridiales bacterium]|jgi:hypothetical protein|nr:hypothetical protein [Clostridiales bacterium]